VDVHSNLYVYGLAAKIETIDRKKDKPASSFRPRCRGGNSANPIGCKKIRFSRAPLWPVEPHDVALASPAKSFAPRGGNLNFFTFAPQIVHVFTKQSP
jgi:hypothetical protein